MSNKGMLMKNHTVWYSHASTRTLQQRWKQGKRVHLVAKTRWHKAALITLRRTSFPLGAWLNVYTSNGMAKLEV
jgi:hypothetical protein